LGKPPQKLGGGKSREGLARGEAAKGALGRWAGSRKRQNEGMKGGKKMSSAGCTLY